MKQCIVAFLFISVILISFCEASELKGKYKILYVDSYHQEYAWSAGIWAGAKSVLGNRKDVMLKIVRMDTKRNTDEEFKKTAALKVKKIIETWKPDVVIASDDNASKYLIVPYYQNVDLPFVFCGVNWDPAPYGYPFKNVTGMVEVLLTKELVKTLTVFAKGNRIGFLAPDMTSTRQIIAYNKKILEIKPSQIKFVSTLKEWKSAYLSLQKSVDILLLTPWQGIPDWDEGQVIAFIQKNTSIPSGTFYDYMAKYSLMCFATDPEEQGEWTANTALEILDGKTPFDIPIVTNKKAKIILNMKLARA